MSERDVTERVKALGIEKGADLVGIASGEELEKLGIPAKNYLPEGRNAVVIGMEYPSSYDENPGALSYIKGVITTKLQFMSLDISSYLERLGYPALPRSGMPDSKAAMAAGLGEIGWNGAVLTPEYGPRQRFVSILTDIPLDPGPALCDRCFLCVEACPVGALGREEKVEVQIGDRIFEYGKLDALRCELMPAYTGGGPLPPYLRAL